MKVRLALFALLVCAVPAAAQQTRYPSGQGTITDPGELSKCLNSQGYSVPCPLADTAPNVTRPFAPARPEDRGQVVTVSPNSGALGQYPANATPITGNSTGTTGAVVGTLPAQPGRRTWICGFNVSSLGGTAATGPITIANLPTSSMIYHLTSSATGTSITQTFTPCIPANALNTTITITTTANGTATAVDVNSWGFQQ